MGVTNHADIRTTHKRLNNDENPTFHSALKEEEKANIKIE